MDRFDAQTLVQSGSDGKTLVLSFEDAKGNRFNLTVPNHVALAMIPILDGLKATSKAAGAYATRADEWRTARDQDSPNVLLEFKGQVPYVFPLKHAQALWQQVRKHCEEIESRPARRDS